MPVMIEYRTSLDNITKDDLNGFFVGWKQPLSNEQLYKALQNSEYVVIAYDTEKKKAVGYINALSEEVNFAFIPMLEVLPEYQKLGIGTELVRKMLQQLEHINCIDLTCDPELKGFYKRFGMIESRGMILRKHLTNG